MSSAKDFRYLIPQKIFDEITLKAAEAYPSIEHYWIFADRKENFGIVTKFIPNPDLKPLIVLFSWSFSGIYHNFSKNVAHPGMTPGVFTCMKFNGRYHTG